MFALDKLYENKVLMISVGAIALLAAALLILFIIRLLFGRRLHMPGGGRARQPRLGIVDAFDLDRQRQLVLVRRDNVEHLVMIGGPNDVLIESQIIRADARPRETTVSPITAAPLAWPGNAAPVAAEPKLAPDDLPVAARDDLRAPAIASAPPLSAPPLAAPSLSTQPVSGVPPLPPEPGFAPTATRLPLPPLPVPPAPVSPGLPIPPAGDINVASPSVISPSVSSPGVSVPPLSAPPVNVPPAPAPAPKRPSFMPPRRPLATPTFGPKPAAPVTPPPTPSLAMDEQRDDAVAVPETAEIPLAPSAPPPRPPLSQPPSFLRQRTAFGGSAPSVPTPAAPISTAPIPTAPIPPAPRPAAVPPIEPTAPKPPVPEEAVQPKLNEPKFVELLPTAPEKAPEPEPKQDALDTLEEEMAKLLGRNLEKP